MNNNNDGGPSNEGQGGENVVKDEGYYGPEGGGDEDESMEPSAKRQRI